MNERPKVTAPNRVVYNDFADATTSERARREYGVAPAVIFLRGDGWSLGAPSRLESVAYETWSDQWEWFARKGDKVFRPISEYTGA